jgi:hypothetical protein
MRTAPSTEIIKQQSYEGEKAQVLKELRALLLTYPLSRKKPRTYIQNSIKFIEQE